MDKGFPQKKVLSLVLCVAVMLSVMVMGAGAAFSDQLLAKGGFYNKLYNSQFAKQ